MRVLAFGTFDHLHPGHIAYLEYAKSKGDLFVIVARDVNVAHIKGSAPDQPEDERVYESKGHVRNFIDCVKSRKETVCPVEMAIRCDTIAHMTNVTAQTGRVITWDPKVEQVVGDAEAAMMLTRPYREKWKIW